MKKISILAIILSLNLALALSAEADSRLWDKGEVPNLNLAKDLKLARVGRDYYIDGINGDDKRGDGSLFSPWRTIGKAFDYYARRPAPGDAVIIKAGTYRERIDIRSGGNEENRILIGPYGDGEVIVDCSDKVEGWALYKGRIYKTAYASRPAAVVLDGKPLFPEFSPGKVDDGKWYYDNKEKSIYLYVKEGEPASHDVGIIKDDEYQYGIFLNNASYVILYGLTVKYAAGHGISILGNNNIIEKCDIKFNGKGGVAIWPYGKMKSMDNKVIKSHVYHNMLKNWPRGRYKSGEWVAGLVSGGVGTHFIGNIVHENGGEGLLTGGKGTQFIDNIVYDNWSVNIYIDNAADTLVGGNLIFSHEPVGAELYNNGDDNPRDGKNFRRLRPEGIMTADEGSPANFHNSKIVNNIIIGCRRGITHYGRAKGSGLKGVFIANNTIIVPDARGVGEDFIGIKISYNDGNNENTVLKNNIIYASYPSSRLFVSTDEATAKDQFKGLVFDHNIWYHAANKKPFRIGPTPWGLYDVDFRAWQAKIGGHGSRNLFTDPLLKNVKGYSRGDAGLLPDSPAKDCGVQENYVIPEKI